MDDNYYVYILFDPRNGLPFYVGKGTGRRYTNHEKEFVKQKEYYSKIYSLPEKMFSLKHKVFYELEQQNLICDFKLIEGLNEDDALLLEHGLIAWFGRKICGNGILTNLLCGGKKGDLYFDDEQLIRLLEREDLQREILKYKKTSTIWIARTLYFYNNDQMSYPFKELSIDWLYQYHGCYQDFAIKVIKLLKDYDSVITPFYWVRKVQKKKFQDDNVYIMNESIELIEGTNINGLKDFEYYKNEYNNLCVHK